MKAIYLSLKGLLTMALLLIACQGSALTVSEFQTICKSTTSHCEDHPILQAYIGGALDVVAVLAEETSYLNKLYCEDTSTLFDVRRIIPFMEQQKEVPVSANAMLVLIRYLEEHGGC